MFIQLGSISEGKTKWNVIKFECIINVRAKVRRKMTKYRFFTISQHIPRFNPVQAYPRSIHLCIRLWVQYRKVKQSGMSFIRMYNKFARQSTHSIC